jgi:CubicO group peptidase (beta-lactamase class C family)
VYNTGLDYPVGTKTIYSDVSMVALQLVIERITGQSMAVFAQENVFIPLGMSSTFYNPPKWTHTCAPTTDVPNYRDQVIRCIVHDPTAWILGGVSGNAGVFTHYKDLKKFMTMML